MSILKSIFFGLVMGLTRILPVSAGAHQLVLFRLFGVTQGGTFEPIMPFRCPGGSVLG